MEGEKIVVNLRKGDFCNNNKQHRIVKPTCVLNINVLQSNVSFSETRKKTLIFLQPCNVNVFTKIFYLGEFKSKMGEKNILF